MAAIHRMGRARSACRSRTPLTGPCSLGNGRTRRECQLRVARSSFADALSRIGVSALDRHPIRSALMRIAIGLLWLLLFSACRTGGALKAPSDGGPSWRTVESEHIVMHTDLSEKQARLAIEQFELRFDLLASLLFDGADPPLWRTRVVAFRRREELLNFTSRNTGAFIRSPVADEGLPTIVMAGKPDARAYGTWQHELTHGFLAAAMGPLPIWVNEGMAEYYSAATVINNRAVLGQSLPEWGFVLGTQWRIEQSDGGNKIFVPVSKLRKPSELTEMSRSDFYANETIDNERDDDVVQAKAINYVSAWTLVHMLLNGPPEYRDRFANVLADVAEGIDFDDAFESRFGDISDDAFDEAFLDHVRRKETQLWETDFKFERTPSIRVEPMPPARVLRLWARLGGFRREENAGPEELLAKALEVNPKDAAILRDRATLSCRQGRWEACEQGLNQAREAAPDDPHTLRALLLLYDGARGPWSEDERRGHLEKLAQDLEQTATNGRHFNALAWYLVRRGRAEDAQPHGRRSLELLPGCWECHDTYALIQAELGNMDAAVAHQRRALAGLNELARQSVADAMLERYYEYRRAAMQGEEASRPAKADDETEVPTEPDD
ncbi:MAG: tetratricopeptide repeat protein [Myxococcales bacterium FL481]|nr:MAG: tetratricopeptide repeat protein [Myxococcales bacterium FL481]